MSIEYKGFVVTQSTYNWHIMVAKDGENVMHVRCDKPKKADELKEVVDTYLELEKYLKENEVGN